MLANPFAGVPALRDANTWKVFMGITEDNQDEYLTALSFARAPADEAWVYSCVRRLYTSAQSVPLRVYSRDGRDLVPVEDSGDPDGLELQYLLDNVNPVDMNGADLKAYTVAGYAVWGGSYWQRVRGRYGGRPRELYYLRVPDVRVESDDGRVVRDYVHTPTRGPSTVIAPRDMLVFKTVNLANPLEPLSPLSAARQQISVNRNAAATMSATLRNQGVPPGYWTVAKGTSVSSQDVGLLRRLLRGLRGPKNAGKTPFIPYEIDYKALSLLPKDAEYIAAQKLSRMAVCAVLGVPLVLAGDDEKSGVYANLRDAERSFWKGTMIPLLDWYADVLNGWLVPEFDPRRVQVGAERPLSLGKLVVGWDYSAIEAIQEPYDARVTAAIQLADRRALTPNELRAMFRLGPPVSWGDQPAPSQTRVMLSGDAPAMFLDTTAPSGAPAPSLTYELGGGVTPDLEWDLPVRSLGRGLYRRPAVRAFIAHGGPLDADALLGRPVPDAIRLVIEDGLRRRYSADQIADSLPVLTGAGSPPQP